MLRDQLRHLEHRDLGFSEDRLQVRVGVDVPSVLFILQVVLLDVFPELLDYLSARKHLGPDDLREGVAGGQRFHESRIYFFCHGAVSPLVKTIVNILCVFKPN